MPDLGLDVLWKGSNFLRILSGLWVALRISLFAVAFSIPLGMLMGVLMTKKNRLIGAVLRVYLEFIRIMPQLVLLFLVYFGTTRSFGWNLSGELASVVVFTLWGTAEMGDLVRGALLRISMRLCYLPVSRTISMRAVKCSDSAGHRHTGTLSFHRRLEG